MQPREKKVKYHFSRIYVAIDLGHVRSFTVGSGSREHLPRIYIKGLGLLGQSAKGAVTTTGCHVTFAVWR